MNILSNVYPTTALQQADARHHWHPFTDTASLNAEGSRVIVAGDGVWLTDSNGNRILDGMAGLWCTNIGHGRAEIAEAVHAQMKELGYYNTFFKTTHPPVIKLAETLAELTPDHINRVFFTSSGSEAIDTVVRMARTYWQIKGQPQKQIILSRRNAYHGSTVAGASLGGMAAMHGQGGLPIPNVEHIAQPYWFGEGGDMSPETFGLWAARQLEETIDRLGEDKVAAFVAEPVQGAGGVIIPPESYWPEIKRICSQRDILLVVDEVICGFGRLGTWFGCDYYGIEADMMPIAKGLSSGYLPIGGVLIADRVAEVMELGGEFFHGYTYSGHPVCCAAAIENLRIMREEKIVERVADDVGPYLQSKWRRLGDHPLVGESRMVGLVGALELVPNKPSRTERFAAEGEAGTICRDIAFNNGLIMRAVRDSMVVSPPLVITHDEIDELVVRAERTLDETMRTLISNGMMTR